MSQQSTGLEQLHLSVSHKTGRPTLALGEVRTGLLPHSGPLRPDATGELLTANPARPVRSWERPIRHVAAAETLTGVDCWMPSATGRKLRGVGTLSTEVRVTGGQVVQAQTGSRLTVAEYRRRLPWSSYLTRPGVIETWGPLRATEITDEFLGRPTRTADGVLDLSGPSAHRLNQVRGSALLDRRQSYRPRQIRLRWAAEVTTGSPAVFFTLIDQQVHTLRLEVGDELLPLVGDLCLDVALHDWLLSCLLDLIDRAGIGGPDRGRVVATLAPAIDHLLPAWLPGARLDPALAPLWDRIDRISGLSRQWESAVARIRDQVALAAVVRDAGPHRPS